MNNYLLSFRNELLRKAVHILSVFIPLIYYISDFHFFIFVIFFFMFIVVFINLTYRNILSRFKYFKIIFSNLLRSYEDNSIWGSTYMISAFFVITLFFDKNIVMLSMLITSLSDSMAAIVGIKYGKIRFKNSKSIEGFYIFTITTFIILFMALNINLYLMLTISILISFVELFSNTKYDNFTIPVFSSLILTLFIK